MYSNGIKRLIDVLVATGILILTFPLFLIIVLVFRTFSIKSVFFIQERPGKDERLFRIYKFKTMTDDRDEQGNLKPDVERLTPLGRVIRNLSLDELPQLMNVLKGDMSLIGPRPLLPEYLPLYNDFQRRRHEVKPGITGWAQVNGRNTLSWEQKFEYDVWYVDNVSFLLDLKILWMTLLKVVKREGVASDTSATMEKFTGTV